MESKKGQYWKWVPLLEMGMPFPVLVNCAFGYLHLQRGALDRVWAALCSTHMYDTRIFSTYTRVPGSVSIHNLRTVAPRYGELLALLVYLTLSRKSLRLEGG